MTPSNSGSLVTMTCIVWTLTTWDSAHIYFVLLFFLFSFMLFRYLYIYAHTYNLQGKIVVGVSWGQEVLTLGQHRTSDIIGLRRNCTTALIVELGQYFLEG